LDWRNPNPYRRYWVLSGLWSVQHFKLLDQACAPYHELTCLAPVTLRRSRLIRFAVGTFVSSFGAAKERKVEATN